MDPQAEEKLSITATETGTHCAPVATHWKYLCISLASTIAAWVLWQNYSSPGGHQETASLYNTKRRLNNYWRNWVPNFSDPATVEIKPTPFPKVLLFITTHFSEQHVRFFQRCWPHSIANSLLLQNADVFVCVTGTANRTLLEALFASNKLRIHEVTNPGYHTGAILALNLSAEHRWFDSYDWVIRQNPDVIVRNDTEILASIMNPAVDGIFVNCRPGGMDTMLQTDWSAFRPAALLDNAFTKEMHGNAERQFTIDMYPILSSGRFVWLPKAGPKEFGNCRVVGDNVMHDHEYLERCESDLQSVVHKSGISGHLHQDVDGIQEDGTYLIFTKDKLYQDCNAVIHEKDQIKRIHHHMASCKHFDDMFGNRLAYMYGIRMIANALQKPFTFTCGMDEGETPNGAVHLMNLFTNIRGPVPHRANGEGYTVEDICQNICNNVFCSWYSRDLDLVAHTMAVDWKHLTSPTVVPILDNDDAVIHLRLGDGLYSTFGANEEKGVFPHATYINLFMQAQQEKGTINSIGIVTAPFKGSTVRSFDVGYTSFSEEIALDLVNALQNAFPKAKISIHNSPEETIMESLARVVHARKVAVCGCSTFCPYPLLATEGIGFMYNPVGAQNQWVRNAAKRYDDFRLFETPMLNGLMIANDKTGWKLDHALVMDWVRHQDPNVGNVDIIEAPIFREPKP